MLSCASNNIYIYKYKLVGTIQNDNISLLRKWTKIWTSISFDRYYYNERKCDKSNVRKYRLTMFVKRLRNKWAKINAAQNEFYRGLCNVCLVAANVV